MTINGHENLRRRITCTFYFQTFITKLTRFPKDYSSFSAIQNFLHYTPLVQGINFLLRLSSLLVRQFHTTVSSQVHDYDHWQDIVIAWFFSFVLSFRNTKKLRSLSSNFKRSELLFIIAVSVFLSFTRPLIFLNRKAFTSIVTLYLNLYSLVRFSLKHFWLKLLAIWLAKKLLFGGDIGGHAWYYDRSGVNH